MATEEILPGKESTPFICPSCGVENPPFYAESGIEYTHFEFRNGDYQIVDRTINITKPPTIFCENCGCELKQHPDLDFVLVFSDE